MIFAQFLKSRFGRFGVMAACLVLVSTVAVATTAVTTGWHGLSQKQRGAQIISTAERDLGRNTHVQCKEWVQNVVRVASGGLSTVPLNMPNMMEWQKDPSVHRCKISIGKVKPGDIIQMRWQNQGNRNIFPHTAIVVSKNSREMLWIDCNWHGDTTVRTHTITFAQFKNCVRNNFTIYRIR